MNAAGAIVAARLAGPCACTDPFGGSLREGSVANRVERLSSLLAAAGPAPLQERNTSTFKFLTDPEIWISRCRNLITLALESRVRLLMQFNKLTTAEVGM